MFTSRTLGVFPEDLVVRPYVSLFHSTHESGNAMADMSDVMLGAIATSGGFTLDTRYAWYTMNPLMRSHVHELGARASYDVVSWWYEEPPPFSLRPFAGVYAEISDQHGSEDVFVNVGLEPTWRFDLAGSQVGLGLPIDWGLSADRYYFDRAGRNATLGYFSTALTTSLSLPTPDHCGRWFLNTSVQYLRLAAPSVRALTSGDRDVWIGKIGVSFVF